jgi:NDP-sugar pyrophosphorylase family protein
MLNVLQLCAGKGSRFAEYSNTAKPFLNVKGNPMFVAAIDSLNLGSDVRYHFLFQERAIKQYNPSQYVDGIIHKIDHYTDGAATSAAYVIRDSEYRNEPWLIVDCDFIVSYDSEKFKKMCDTNNCIFVQHRPYDVKSSYSCVDKDMNVLGVAEKQMISEYRNSGQYHWVSGDVFIESYDFYSDNGLVSLGEYYTAPLYNYAIQKGVPTVAIPVDSFTPIGTPIDYERYINEIC